MRLVEKHRRDYRLRTSHACPKGQPDANLSPVLAAAAGTGAVINVAGLNLVRDVLLGLLFMLWTVWWVWLLVIFARQKETAVIDSPS